MMWSWVFLLRTTTVKNMGSNTVSTTAWGLPVFTLGLTALFVYVGNRIW